MAAGMRRAADTVKKSAADMKNGFNGAAERLKLLKDAAGASTGSIRDMAGVLRAGPAGLALAGVAALGVGMLKTAQAADTLAMRAVKAADEAEAAFKKATGRDIDIGFNRIDTWTGQWDRLKEAALGFAGALGHRLGTLEAWKRATEALADALARLEERFKTDDQRRDEKNLETSRKGLEAQAKQAEREMEMGRKRNEQANEAIREQGRKMEESARRAQSVMDSVKTPWEKFYEKMADLKKLRAEGFLNDDFFGRAKRQAEEELKKATKTPEAKAQSVGAVERFTMAGFSAVQRFADDKKIEAHAKKTADNTGVAVKQLADIASELRNPRNVLQVAVSDL